MNLNLILYVLLSSYIVLVKAGGNDRSVIDHSFIESNPKYKPKRKTLLPSHKDKDDLHEDHNEEISEEEEDFSIDDQRIKAILQRSLYKTRKTSSKTLRFMKKHHTYITTALIFYAFRRELWNILVTFTTRPSPDGKGRIFKFSVSPTSILKILLFIGMCISFFTIYTFIDSFVMKNTHPLPLVASSRFHA